MVEKRVFAPEENSTFPRTADSDVVIQSSDGVQFHLHKKYLEAGTGAFPPADTPTNNEIVSLSESEATLEILFRFIYPRRYPSIDALEYDALILLAEAAEKYEVFVVIYVCQIRLRVFLRRKSKSLLAFAAKHNHLDLIIELAPIMIDTPVQKVAHLLPPHIFRPWCLYRERWTSAVQTAMSSLPIHRCLRLNSNSGSGSDSDSDSDSDSNSEETCEWLTCVSEVVPQLVNPSDLRRVNQTFEPYIKDELCYVDDARLWKLRIETAVKDILPMSLESLSTKYLNL